VAGPPGEEIGLDEAHPLVGDSGCRDDLYLPHRDMGYATLIPLQPIPAKVQSMALKRLTPMIRRYDLGLVRMWRNELVEIVRLISELDEAEVEVVADDQYKVDDIEDDLSAAGPKLKSLTVTASRTSDGILREFIKVHLSEAECTTEATDPDLATLGAMDQIRSLADECGRMPKWALRLYRDGRGQRDPSAAGLLAAAILAGVATVITAISNAITHYRHEFPLPTDIVLTSVALLIVYFFLLGLIRTRTVLYTGTRVESPTFWQEHRADIAINIGVSIVFFVLGRLTQHL
jgi:hypothetical protein